MPISSLFAPRRGGQSTTKLADTEKSGSALLEFVRTIRTCANNDGARTLLTSEILGTPILVDLAPLHVDAYQRVPAATLADPHR